MFIEHSYLKRFGIDRPAAVLSLEDWVARKQARKAQKREAQRHQLAEPSGQPSQGVAPQRKTLDHPAASAADER